MRCSLTWASSTGKEEESIPQATLTNGKKEQEKGEMCQSQEQGDSRPAGAFFCRPPSLSAFLLLTPLPPGHHLPPKLSSVVVSWPTCTLRDWAFPLAFIMAAHWHQLGEVWTSSHPHMPDPTTRNHRNIGRQRPESLCISLPTFVKSIKLLFNCYEHLEENRTKCLRSTLLLS